MTFATPAITILIMIAILVPGSDLPDVDIGGIDKVFHLGMFGAWAIAARYDLKAKPGKLYLIFLAGLTFSLLTELAQLVVEGRSFDVYDMVADALGLILGLLVSGKVIALLK